MTELDPKRSLQDLYARALARERNRAGLSQEALGAHAAVMVSGKLIGHVENCRRPPTRRLSKGIDKALALKEFFEALYLHYAKEEGPPPAIYEYVELEDQASSIKIYNSHWITGLLQTEAYAREQLAVGQRPERVEELVAARLDRQEILTREDPPWLMVAIDEYALRRVVGGPEVMRGQYEHLLKMMQEPNISIVIVPAGAAIYPAGSFILLGFDEISDMGYVEAVAGHSQVITHGAQVSELAVMFDRISSVALTVADSEKLIRKLLEDLS